MKRNSKREASVFDFWGGIAQLRREVQGEVLGDSVCDVEGDRLECKRQI